MERGSNILSSLQDEELPTKSFVVLQLSSGKFAFCCRCLRVQDSVFIMFNLALATEKQIKLHSISAKINNFFSAKP